MDIPCITRGDAGRRPLVFLHGFLGQPGEWMDFMEDFADRHYCVAIDYAALPVQPLTQLADHLAAAMTPGTVLVGYSMGARLALSMAVYQHMHCGGLVLESGSPGLPPREASRRGALSEQHRDQLASLGLPAFLEQWYQQPLFASLAARPELLQQVIAEKSGLDAAYWEQAVVQLGISRQPDYRRKPYGDRLDMPLLAIAGELDAPYAGLARETAALAPNGHSCIIPGAGHNVHLEQPDAFRQALHDFLERNEL